MSTSAAPETERHLGSKQKKRVSRQGAKTQRFSIDKIRRWFEVGSNLKGELLADRLRVWLFLLCAFATLRAKDFGGTF